MPKQNFEENRSPQHTKSSTYSGRKNTKRRPNNAKSLVTPARLYAYSLVRSVHTEGISVHEAARRISPKTQISNEDISFALLLATGVISTYGSLNQILNRILNKPEDVSSQVRDALCVSSYEIVYLNKAAHAAVDQGVELVRAIAPKATKLANFVLRRVIDTKKALSSSKQKSLEDEALLAGFPNWMISKLVQSRGEAWTQAFLKHSGEQSLVKSAAPIWFIFNENRVDGAVALEKLIERGISIAPEKQALSNQASAFKLKNRKDVSDELFTGLLKEGALVVSDYSAQTVVALSLNNLEQPQSFLEIGAGRGTKTIMLQNTSKRNFGTQMNLTSIEVNQHKARILKDRCKKAQVESRVLCLDATDLSSLDESYDAILLDAPCSGSGTMRRHPEIKWRITKEDVSAITELEFKLLKEAATKLALGGVLTYATCSVFKEENEDIINRFLETEEGQAFEIQAITNGLKYFFINPAANGPDIHFACRLKRIK